MEQIKITIAVIIAVLLQWSLRNVHESMAFVDFPLITIVYAALQRNAFKSLLFGTLAGIAVDALSGGLLGANGFAKTLIAYAVSELARRVYLDNLLLRIPVIAGASVVNNLVYFGLHHLFGQEPSLDLATTTAYSVIGTTIIGTIVYLLFERFSGEKLVRRRRGNTELFKSRRQTRRRNPIRLTKRS